MQVIQIAETILRKKDNVLGLKLADFKTYYKPVVIQTVCYWNKDSHIDQCLEVTQKSCI